MGLVPATGRRPLRSRDADEHSAVRVRRGNDAPPTLVPEMVVAILFAHGVPQWKTVSISCSVRVPRDREREDRTIVNAGIGMVNARIGIVNTAS